MSVPFEFEIPRPRPARRVYAETRPASDPTGLATAVYWLPPETLPAGFSGFNVYRSPEPTSDLTSPSLELLTPIPVGVPFFLDPQPQTEPLGVPSYLVTVIGSSGEDAIDRPVQVGDTSDPDRQGRRFPVLSMPRIFQEFRRRKDILLGLNAEKVTFLIRRMVGHRCRLCFKGPYEGSAQASCPVCTGTGWERGYEVLPDVLCRIGTLAEALRLQPAGLEFSSNPKGWLVGFPLLRNGDALVRSNGKRYAVQRIDLTVHQGILTGQDFDLVAYEPFHPIYAFPTVP